MMVHSAYIARKLGDGCTSSHGKHVDDEPSGLCSHCAAKSQTPSMSLYKVERMRDGKDALFFDHRNAKLKENNVSRLVQIQAVIRGSTGSLIGKFPKSAKCRTKLQ
ncbi:hypothetical protein O9992_22040 [Vibrio lentus]|nr:hypothetical protein [Vibrio lentus]